MADNIGDPEIADTGATIQIEHAPNAGVVIRVIYPDDRQRKDLRTLKILCAVFCVVPGIAWLFVRDGPNRWFVPIAVAVGGIYFIVNTIRRFFAVTRSYVFRADQNGLTIETSGGRRRTEQHFSPEQVVDIILKFSFFRGRNSVFRCWMLIETSAGLSNIRCLHDIGGDHLARIADLLRAALGMPKRAWP